MTITAQRQFSSPEFTGWKNTLRWGGAIILGSLSGCEIGGLITKQPTLFFDGPVLEYTDTLYINGQPTPCHNKEEQPSILKLLTADDDYHTTTSECEPVKFMLDIAEPLNKDTFQAAGGHR